MHCHYCFQNWLSQGKKISKNSLFFSCAIFFHRRFSINIFEKLLSAVQKKIDARMKMMREMLEMKTSLSCEKGKRSQVIITLFVAVDIPYHVMYMYVYWYKKKLRQWMPIFFPQKMFLFFLKIDNKKNFARKKWCRAINLKLKRNFFFAISMIIILL